MMKLVNFRTRGDNFLFVALSFFILLSSFYMKNASATCVYGSYESIYLQFGRVVVSADLPVGGVVATLNVTPSSSGDLRCSNGGMVYNQMNMTSANANFANVYDIPDTTGLGVRIKMNGVYFANPMASVTIPASVSNAIHTPITAELVKTQSSSGAGQLTSFRPIAYVNDQSKTDSFSIWWGQGTTIAIGTCSVTSRNLIFPIGNVPASAFTGINTSPPNAKNTQQLTLNCVQGTSVKATMTGTKSPDTTNTSVLALTGQGGANVAQGVGVQILYNNTPLQLNNKIALQDSAPGGVQQIDLTARYFQTKAGVTMGTANSSATLTLTYE